MKKGCSFFFVMAVLIVVSFICLASGVSHNNLSEYVCILIACIVLSDLSLAFVKGWDLLTFVLMLLLTCLVVFSMIPFNLFIYLLAFGIVSTHASDLMILVYGVRTTSMVWPFVILYLGIQHYYKMTLKEMAKQKKSKKEAPKAEQKL